MRIDPIYAPNHRGMEWKTFVEAEWSPISKMNHDNIVINGTSGVYPNTESAIDARIPDDDDDADWDDRAPEDTSAREDENSSRLTRRMSPKVDTNHVSSGDSVGMTSKPFSFYEVKMGESGYYSSILELRADKIRAAVKGSLYRPDVYAALPIRYEDLLQPYKASESSSSLDGSNSPSHLPGIVGLISRIQSLAGMSPNAELSKSFFPDPIGCNGHVCYPSIDKMRQNGEYIAYMNDHLDWHAEQLMGYQKLSSHPKPSVSRIVVLGERHSRAEWLVDRLSRCFPGVEVSKYYLSILLMFSLEPISHIMHHTFLSSMQGDVWIFQTWQILPDTYRKCTQHFGCCSIHKPIRLGRANASKPNQRPCTC